MLPVLWTAQTDAPPTGPWKSLRDFHSTHSPNRRSFKRKTDIINPSTKSGQAQLFAHRDPRGLTMESAFGIAPRAPPPPSLGLGELSGSQRYIGRIVPRDIQGRIRNKDRHEGPAEVI